MTQKVKPLKSDIRLVDILEKPFEGLSLIQTFDTVTTITVPYKVVSRYRPYFCLEPQVNDIMICPGSGKAYLKSDAGIARIIDVMPYYLSSSKYLCLDHIVEHYPETLQPRDLRSLKDLAVDGFQLHCVTLSFLEGFRHNVKNFYLADIQYVDPMNRIKIHGTEVPNTVSLRSRVLARRPSFRLPTISPAE